MSENGFIRGVRVSLRRLRASADLSDVFKWTREGDVRKYLLQDRLTSCHQVVDWLHRVEKSTNGNHFGIRRERDWALVGYVGFMPNGDAEGAELQFLIGEPESWGMGFGTEAVTLALSFAFGELGCSRIVGRVWQYDKSGLSILKELGATAAETEERKHHFEGQTYPTHTYTFRKERFADVWARYIAWKEELTTGP